MNYALEKLWKEEFVTFVFNDWRKDTATLAVIVGIEAGTQSISRIQIRNAIVWGRMFGAKHVSAICYSAAQCSSTDREKAKFKLLQIQGVR